jgi:formylglycine-generating enzyme required for sulfatase activity
MSRLPITYPGTDIAIRAVTFDEAVTICRKLGGSLPSKADFDVLGGMVLDNVKDPVWTWSTEAAEKMRVLRGGSWDNGSQDALSAAVRYTIAPSRRHDNIGFRCVWVLKRDIPKGIEVIEIPEVKTEIK